MKKESRKEELIDYLLLLNGYVTVKELANIFNVSERTIHNDLLSLAEVGYNIDKKQGIGVKLQKNDSNKKICFEQVDRKIEIAEILIINEDKITIQQLADNYYVSKSSIQADLNAIKNDLIDDYTAKIVSDIKGTRIEGTEEEIQRLLVKFNEKYLVNNLKYFNSKTIIGVYSNYYPEKIVNACSKIIRSFDLFSLQIRDSYYLLNIFNVLVVLIYRISKDKHIEQNKVDVNLDEVMNLNNYLIAKDIFKLINESIDFNYHDKDIFYLSVYIRANGIRFLANKQIYEDKFIKNIELLIEKISANLNVNLNDDEELKNNLCLHIINMKFRSVNNIRVKNPLLSQIKEEFKVMYNLTWIVMEELKDVLGVKINEDEVGFIMIHLQTSYDRNQKNKKILIVCPNGFTMGNFILNRIRLLFPLLDNIEVISHDNLKKVNLEKIDLIISTIPLEVENVRIVQVSSLITERDIKLIGEIYTDIISHTDINYGIKNKYIKSYVDNDLFFENSTSTTMEEVIDIVCENLLDKGIVKEGYKESVIERENKGGTSIATLSAVPHGSLELVNETKIVFWINKSAIKWGKYNVKVIVFICLAKKDVKLAKKILEDVFSLINTKEKVEKELLICTKDELYKKIIGG